MKLPAALQAVPVVAVVREGAGRDDLVDVVGALIDAGVRAIEITVDTPGWSQALAAWRHRDDVVLGAGTVCTVQEVDDVGAAGGRFVVSPHTDPELIAAAAERRLASLPGAFTASEIRAAVTAGADLVKLFPAGPAGTSYLRALRGPFGDVPFVPTGGIEPADVRSWLAAGATAVGLGSALVSGTPTEIQARARDLVRDLG